VGFVLLAVLGTLALTRQGDGASKAVSTSPERVAKPQPKEIPLEDTRVAQLASTPWCAPALALPPEPHRSQAVVSTIAVESGCLVARYELVPEARASARVAELYRAPDVVTAAIERGAGPVALDGSCESTFATPKPVGDLLRYQWPLTTRDVVKMWQYGSGRGVVVGVVDISVDGNHPDLQPNMQRSLNVFDGIDVTDYCHGTHVAGIAAGTSDFRGITGVAPNARIVGVTTAGAPSSDRTLTIGLARGIAAAVDAGATVINLSMRTFATSRAEAAHVEGALRAAVSRGVSVVMAAGNCGPSAPTDDRCPDGVNTRTWPQNFVNGGEAWEESLLGVASINRDNKVSGFSSRHPHVSVAAPGSRVVSSIPTQYNDGYNILSGTSMASPFVAGLVAALRGVHPALNNVEVARIVTRSAEVRPAHAPDNETGYGVAAPIAAFKLARQLDLPNLEGVIGCLDDCEITGRITFDHPTWGESVLVTTSDDLCQKGGIYAVDSEVRLRWSRPLSSCVYPDDPERDGLGHLFVRNTSGAGVNSWGLVVLAPTTDGFEDFGSITDDPTNSIYGRFAGSSATMPLDDDSDGVFEIDVVQSDCIPDCAGGQPVRLARYRWNGRDYVADRPPEAPSSVPCDLPSLASAFTRYASTIPGQTTPLPRRMIIQHFCSGEWAIALVGTPDGGGNPPTAWFHIVTGQWEVAFSDSAYPTPEDGVPSDVQDRLSTGLSVAPPIDNYEFG
jgi:membrane-anchored mycosin MYCP